MSASLRTQVFLTYARNFIKGFSKVAIPIASLVIIIVGFSLFPKKDDSEEDIEKLKNTRLILLLIGVGLLLYQLYYYSKKGYSYHMFMLSLIFVPIISLILIIVGFSISAASQLVYLGFALLSYLFVYFIYRKIFFTPTENSIIMFTIISSIILLLSGINDGMIDKYGDPHTYTIISFVLLVLLVLYMIFLRKLFGNVTKTKKRTL